MAELIGLLASLATLIEVVKETVDYVVEVKNATKERTELDKELEGLLVLLQALQSQVNRADEPITESLLLLRVPLEDLQLNVDYLKAKFNPSSTLRKYSSAIIWPLRRADYKAKLDAIERNKSLLSLALGNNLRDVTLAIRSETQALPGIAENLSTLRLGVDHLQQAATTQASGNERRFIEEVLTWVSPLNFHITHQDVIAQRKEGTCEWLFHTEEVKTWLNRPCGVLWCHGIPGAGKSVLAASLAEYLEDQYVEPGHAKVIKIYCQYNQKTQQTPSNLIGAMWKQLVLGERQLSSDAQRLRQKHEACGTRPSLQELTALLLSEMCDSSKSKRFIVLDALDECPADIGHDYRTTLMETLQDLSKHCHIAFTSRPLNQDSVETNFPGHLRLEVTANAEDIRVYTLDRLLHKDRLLKQNIKRDDKLLNLVVKTVTGKCEDMFLMARLQLDALATKSTPSQLRKALETLSVTPYELYAQAVDRIYNQDQESISAAITILSWVSKAERPLTVPEILHALAVQYDIETLEQDDLVMDEYLTQVCAGLITVDEESNVVRFVHYTTLSYFEDRAKTSQNFLLDHTTLAKSCLRYLLLDNLAARPARKFQDLDLLMAENPFWKYSASYWGHHYRRGNASPDFATLVSLLRSPARCYLMAQSLMYAYCYWAPVDAKPSSFVVVANMAAYFGLIELLQYFLAEDDVRKDDFKLLSQETAQQWPVDGIVQATKSDQHYGCILHWAAMGHQRPMIELLLSQEPGPGLLEFRNSNNQTPLMFAINSCYAPEVELFVKYGADTFARTRLYGRTTLHLATITNQPETIKALLTCENNQRLLEARSFSGKTVIHYSIYYNNSESLATLLDCGASLLSLDYELFTTPVHNAARWGKASLLDRILSTEAGAKLVDLPDRANRSTPLHHVCRLNSGPETLEVLLKHGADPQKRDDSGLNALQIAFLYGNAQILERLLKTVPTEEFSSIVRYFVELTCLRDDTNVLAMLLPCYGCDYRAAEGNGTFFHLALKRGLPRIAELFLSHFANTSILDERDQKGRTALHCAAKGGFVDLCRILINAGAELCVEDCNGRQPMHYAASTDSSRIVALLMECGGDPNACDSAGNSPFAVALEVRGKLTCEVFYKSGVKLPAPLESSAKNWLLDQSWFLHDSDGKLVQSHERITVADCFEAAFLLRSIDATSSIPLKIVNHILELAEYWARADYSHVESIAFHSGHHDYVYLETEAIQGTELQPVRRIVWRTTNHDQRLYDDITNPKQYFDDYTWFEARYRRGNHVVKGPEIDRHDRLGTVYKNHINIWDQTTRNWEYEGYNWIKELRRGDRIQLIPRADFPVLMTCVAHANISVYTSVLKRF